MKEYVRHVVGASIHHGHHHGRGFGFFPYPVYDYPVYVTCPPGWGLDQYGHCQPLEQHKVGQDAFRPRYSRVGQAIPAENTGFNPFNPFGLGFQFQQSQEAKDLNAQILAADSRVAAGQPKIPPALFQQYMQFRASWTAMYAAGNLSVNQTNGARAEFQSLLSQLQPYIDMSGIMPNQGGLLGNISQGASNLGKGISNAAWIISGFGLAIVGVIAYTAYKTDAPRHAAEYGKASLAHADESTRLAARLIAK